MRRALAVNALWLSVAALPSLLMVVIAFYLHATELERQRTEFMAEQARLVASAVDLRLERFLNLTRFCASDPAIVTDMDPEGFLASCGRYAAMLDAWVVVVAVGSTHQQIINSRSDAPKVLPSYPRASEHATLLALEETSRQTGRAGIADVFTGKIYTGGIISAGQWVRLSDGRDAMVYVSVSASDFSQQLAELAGDNSTIFTLLDSSKRIVSRSRDIEKYMFVSSPEWLARAEIGQGGAELSVPGPAEIGGVWDAGFHKLIMVSGWMAVAVQPVGSGSFLWEFFSLETMLVLFGIASSAIIAVFHAMRARNLDMILAAKRAQELAEQQSQEKSRLLATFAHDVRTPLVSMIGSISVMHESESPDTSYLRSAQASAESLLQLVDDILELSFLGSEGFTLQRSPVDLRALSNDLLAEVRLRAESKGLTLNLAVHPDVPQTVEIDRLRLQQVLRNLLTNAVKYTEHGGITLRITSSTIQKGDVTLIFSVSDTGVGIDKADLQRVFREFGRLDRPIEQREVGTGLGLAICKRILKAMKSELTVESTVGVGSTFSFQLQASVPQTDLPSLGTNPLAGLTILYAEDESIIRRVTARQLRDAGATVIEVAGGQGALDILETLEPDLVLLDIQMPGVDGVETLRRLKLTNPQRQYPVFVLTSHISGHAVAEARSLGADEVFTKPVQIHPLAAAVLARRGDNGKHTPNIGGRNEVEDDELLLEDNFRILFNSYSPSEMDKNILDLESQMRAKFVLLGGEIVDRNYANVRWIAHQCLGVFLVFGANALANRMTALERAAELGQQSVIASLYTKLAACLEKTVAKMRQSADDWK